jgi:2-polyprenyl-3-methyl-5-hydroxy-6-metoxy-1,4-benzoquinol methylase
MRNDRERWNRRYAEGFGNNGPDPFLTSLDSLLPGSGTALDVAGGAGRNALWLAERGLDVTLADVSDVAVARAQERAAGAGLALQTIVTDLTGDPLPPGPWDLIVCIHYLHRELFPAMAAALAPAGLLVCSIATVRNRERHERPRPPFVLEEGELPGLVEGLEVVACEEGWFDDHHDARLVARRPV